VNTNRNLAQNSLPFECRQPARGSERFDGGGDGGFGMLAASLVDVRDERSIIRRPHIDDVTLFQPLPIQKKSVGCHRSHRYLCHSLTSFDPLSIRERIRVVVCIHF